MNFQEFCLKKEILMTLIPELWKRKLKLEIFSLILVMTLLPTNLPKDNYLQEDIKTQKYTLMIMSKSLHKQ